MKIALVLGGGAPNLTLMSGALLALDEQGVTFDVVSTTGAGMLIGLLYAAPRGGDRRTALRSTTQMSVSDEIYRLFPVNFKVFHKPGPAAVAYTRAMAPWLEALPTATPIQRLWSDWAQMLSATLCPTDLNPTSLGLCQPPPWIERLVDFDALKQFPGGFYMSAYSLDHHTLKIFDKDEITPDHFKAALAMPFIYSPYTVGNELFIEGSAVDTLNYEALVEDRHLHIDVAVTFDILGHDRIIQKPRSLYDAWVQSIMVPLTHIAKAETELFRLMPSKSGHAHTKALLIPFEKHIAPGRWAEMTDWSRSNMTYLFEAGYAAGQDFFETHNHLLSRTSGHSSVIEYRSGHVMPVSLPETEIAQPH